MFPKTLDEIYEYNNFINDLGYFCRNFSIITLCNNENKLFNQKQMIFFTDDNIKRFYNIKTFIRKIFEPIKKLY